MNTFLFKTIVKLLHQIYFNMQVKPTKRVVKLISHK